MPTAQAMTRPPFFHFFGYYGIRPWNSRESKLLSLEVDFQNRPPGPADRAVIGLVDCDSLAYAPLAETTAWNFQQGCMVHWLPTAPSSKVIFNVRRDDRYASTILDIDTGERRYLPRPVSALSHDGRYALSLNFARLHSHRPGYGYAGLVDQFAGERHPAEDGVYVMDLATGENWLAVSMQDVVQMNARRTGLGDVDLWFNHTMFNTDDSRFVFLSRFSRENLRRSAMLTSDLCGDDVHLLVDYGLVSHFDWQDEHKILAWAEIDGRGDAFYMVDDRDGGYEKVGEDKLKADGHCSFSPDREWILTDTYPERDMRELMIFSLRTGELVSLGQYYSVPALMGEIRCDLHPRWNHSGNKICFDSTHSGQRQLYVLSLDVA